MITGQEYFSQSISIFVTIFVPKVQGKQCPYPYYAYLRDILRNKSVF